MGRVSTGPCKSGGMAADGPPSGRPEEAPVRGDGPGPPVGPDDVLDPELAAEMTPRERVVARWIGTSGWARAAVWVALALIVGVVVVFWLVPLF